MPEPATGHLSLVKVYKAVTCVKSKTDGQHTEFNIPFVLL